MKRSASSNSRTLFLLRRFCFPCCAALQTLMPHFDRVTAVGMMVARGTTLTALVVNTGVRGGWRAGGGSSAPGSGSGGPLANGEPLRARILMPGHLATEQDPLVCPLLSIKEGQGLSASHPRRLVGLEFLAIVCTSLPAVLLPRLRQLLAHCLAHSLPH